MNSTKVDFEVVRGCLFGNLDWLTLIPPDNENQRSRVKCQTLLQNHNFMIFIKRDKKGSPPLHLIFYKYLYLRFIVVISREMFWCIFSPLCTCFPINHLLCWGGGWTKQYIFILYSLSWMVCWACSQVVTGHWSLEFIKANPIPAKTFYKQGLVSPIS